MDVEMEVETMEVAMEVETMESGDGGSGDDGNV